MLKLMKIFYLIKNDLNTHIRSSILPTHTHTFHIRQHQALRHQQTKSLCSQIRMLEGNVKLFVFEDAVIFIVVIVAFSYCSITVM